MHRKGAQDKKRSKIFSKLGREITVASREGGSDPDNNIRLRSAILNAKSLNMPKSNIERAIQKGETNDPESNYEPVRYEGYGPSGVAIIVETMTNNKNRTASEIRSTFTKYGGNLGETGSVSYNFEHLGLINVKKENIKEEDLFEFVIENKSIDFEVNDDYYGIYCDVKDLHTLNLKINKKFETSNSTELVWKSKNSIDLNNENNENLFKIINSLEENEDVQSVSSNYDVSDEQMKKFTL